MTTLTGTVLLFNASFEPLGRVSFQHAVKMLVREVAVVHEAHGELRRDQVALPPGGLHPARRAGSRALPLCLLRPPGQHHRPPDPALPRGHVDVAQHGRGLRLVQRAQGQQDPR